MQHGVRPGPADHPHPRRAQHPGPVRGRAGPRGRPRRRPGRHRRPPRPGGALPGRGRGPAVRIDVLSIFPDYLAPLSLSLPGKARDKGLLDLHVHDLRSWTTDRHHTVDDTPYGGGAGMVMKPEPWGEALDEVATDRPTIVFTTPSGEPFSQALARELSTREHLVFACGRYEGIDQRVIDARRHPRRGPRDLAGRLRPQRGRGGRAGHHRGRRPAAPGLHGQRRVPRRGVPRGRPAGVPRLHQARQLARPRRPRRAAVGRPRPDRRVAPRAGRTPHGRASPGPRGPLVRARRARRSASAAPADAGEIYTLQRACWLQELRGQPGRRHPRAHRVAGRRAGRAVGPPDLGRAPRRPAGRLGPGPPDQPGRLGHRPADGGPRPPGPGARPAPPGARRGGGAAGRRRRTSSSPAPGSADNLRMYKKAGYRPAARPQGAARARSSSPSVAARSPRGPISRPRRDLANSSLGPAGQTIAPTHAPGGSATNTCHRGCATPPASTARPPDQPSDSAVGLWHS